MARQISEARRGQITYSFGFLVCLALTLVAYNAVTGAWFAGTTLVIVLILLAVVQMVVQLIFFLHLDKETGLRLKLLAFGFMMLLMLIVVIGSLWIMHHLNYNMMELDPHAKDAYMNIERDKGF